MFDLNQEIKQSEAALGLEKKPPKKKRRRKKNKRDLKHVLIAKHWHKRLEEDSKELKIPISRILDRFCYHAYRIARTKTGRQSLFGLNDKILMENEKFKELFKYDSYNPKQEELSPIVFFVTEEEIQSLAQGQFDQELREDQLKKVHRYIMEDIYAHGSLHQEVLRRVVKLLIKGEEPE